MHESHFFDIFHPDRLRNSLQRTRNLDNQSSRSVSDSSDLVLLTLMFSTQWYGLSLLASASYNTDI